MAGGLLAALAAILGLWLTSEDTEVIRPSVDAPTTGAPRLEGLRTQADADGPAAVAVREAPGTAGRFAISGQVLGAAFRPEAGAKVAVRAQARVLAAGETDATGRFHLTVDRFDTRERSYALRASIEGQSATRIIRPGPTDGDHLRVGTLVLGPAHTVPVRVLHEGSPVADAEVHVYLHRPYDRRSHHGLTGEISWTAPSYQTRTSIDGTALLREIPPGATRLLVLQQNRCLRGELVVQVPHLEMATVHVEAARHLRVTVVDRETSEPVRGCHLVVLTEDSEPLSDPLLPLPTDAHGRSVISCLPRTTPLTINVVGPGFVYPYGEGVEPGIVPPEVDRMTIPVPEMSEIRLPIACPDGPVPADGTHVVVVSERGTWGTGLPTDLPPTATIEGEQLVLRTRRGRVRPGFAVLPDGRRGNINGGRQGVVEFRKPYALTVRVLEEGTRLPVPGTVIGVRSIRSWPGRAHLPPRRVDAQGVAHLAPILPARVAVYATYDAELVSPIQQGLNGVERAVDLTTHIGELELLVPRKRVLRIHFREGGRPHLPAGLELFIDWAPGQLTYMPAAWADWDARQGWVDVALRVEADDDEDAYDVAQVLAKAPGYATTAMSIPYPRHDGLLHAQLDLRPAATVHARVLTEDGFRRRVWLFQADDADDRSAESNGREARPETPRETGSLDHKFHGVPPGRYVLCLDHWSLDSPAFDLRPGLNQVTFDARSVGWARGRVQIPEGLDAIDVTVFVRDPATGQRLSVGALDDANFTVAVPGDRTVEVAAEHPDCAPIPAEERFRVRKPTSGIEIVLKRR